MAHKQWQRHFTLREFTNGVHRHALRLQVYMQRSGSTDALAAKKAQLRITPHLFALDNGEAEGTQEMLVDTISKQTYLFPHVYDAYDVFFSPHHTWMVVQTSGSCFSENQYTKCHFATHTTFDSKATPHSVMDITDHGIVVAQPRTNGSRINGDVYAIKGACVQLRDQPHTLYEIGRELPPRRTVRTHVFEATTNDSRQHACVLSEKVKKTLYTPTSRLLVYTNDLNKNSYIDDDDDDDALEDEWCTDGTTVWCVSNLQLLAKDTVFANARFLVYVEQNDKTTKAFAVDRRSRVTYVPFSSVLSLQSLAFQADHVWMYDAQRAVVYRVSLLDGEICEAVAFAASR